MKVSYQVLTSPARGAIAVVQIQGQGAVDLVDRVFRPNRGSSLASTPEGRLRLGRAGLGIGDEVVAVRLAGSVPLVEIQCHGGPAAVEAVVGALEQAGAIEETASDSTIEARALHDLARAPTLRSAAILLDQANGALSAAIHRLLEAIQLKAEPGPALATLIGRGEIGTRLLTGWRVAIAGRPNVGKSRLFNALAGYDRSIVDPTPGATRDVVAIRTAFGGWPVELSDTAGDREDVGPVERIGIDLGRQERRDADLVLLVLDRSEPLHEVDRRLLEEIPGALVVANKSDRPPAWRREEREAIEVSAETGEGIDPLVHAIESRLVPDPPPLGEAVPFRREQVQALREARQAESIGDPGTAAKWLTSLNPAAGPHSTRSD